MAAEFEVEVVRAHLADFPDLTRFAAVLAEDERARARGYKVQEPGDVFTLARGLLRTGLARRLGASTGDIHFDLRASGKPDLRPSGGGRPDWRFSVSHTGPHVAIAFALGVDVGIDIERLDRTVNPLDIARRYFTAEELRSLESIPAEARTRAFLAGWTRKEAIVKARGDTMAGSLTTLSVDLDPTSTHPRSEDIPAAPLPPICRLTAFEFPEHNLIGAVALRSERTPRLKFEMLSGTRFD
jgi:4'-phosphopantetheinyl transferase